MFVKKVTNLKSIIFLTVIVICIVFGFGYYANRVIGEISPLTTPGTPVIQVGTTNQNIVQVNLSWKASTGDSVNIVKGYEIARSNDVNFSTADSSTFITTADTASLITSGDTVAFNDSVNQSSKKFYYRIRAYADGNVWSQPSGISETYITGPTAIAQKPLDNSTGESIKPVLQVSFDQDIDPLTINPSTVTLKPSGGSNLAGTEVTYDSPTRTANLSITGTLLPNTNYVLTISDKVKNISGFALANTVDINFKTGSSNNYPHGGYTLTTAQCSRCHYSSHSSVGASLLKTTNTNDGCFTCHNGTQDNQVGQDYFGQSNYQSSGHFNSYSGSIPVRSDCGICHTPHGSDYPKLLNGQYDMNASATKTGFSPSDSNSCITSTCHTNFNNLATTGKTKFFSNDLNEDLHYAHLIKAGLNTENKGSAVCFECHRPHGPVASEIAGADQDQTLLDKAHQVGFPSTATVIPLQGNSNPTFVLNPVADRVGGGCQLTCHGVTHIITTPADSSQVDSRYDNTP